MDNTTRETDSVLEIRRRLNLWPDSGTPNCLGLGLDYKAEPGDIFTISYTRSGRTWTKYILWSLNHGGAVYPIKDGTPKLHQEYLRLERDGAQAVKASKKPRVITTHLPMDVVPQNPEAFYIMICRNPKDVLVSNYYMHRRFGIQEEFKDFNVFMDAFLNGKLENGCYFDNLKTLLSFLSQENCFLLRYEDLVSDPKNTIRKLANFIGHHELPDEIIEKVVENTRFEEMNKNQNAWHGKSAMREEIPYVRQGKVGAWPNYLTSEQSDAVDRKFQLEMHGTEAEFWWTDVMKKDHE